MAFDVLEGSIKIDEDNGVFSFSLRKRALLWGKNLIEISKKVDVGNVCVRMKGNDLCMVFGESYPDYRVEHRKKYAGSDRSLPVEALEKMRDSSPKDKDAAMALMCFLAKTVMLPFEPEARYEDGSIVVEAWASSIWSAELIELMSSRSDIDSIGIYETKTGHPKAITKKQGIKTITLKIKMR